MWNAWPLNVSRPGTPGSFGLCRKPFESTTKRARIASPRSVWMIQRDEGSSHSSVVTLVENSARSRSPKVSAILSACRQISGANTYFMVGRVPTSSTSGR